MHLPTLALLLTTTSLTSASVLTKRCSPRYDPDLAKGYLPPAPCWQTFDPSCTPYLAQGTEQTVFANRSTVIVFGVSDYCAAEIAEEQAREKDGRKNNGWTKNHGTLTYIKAGILVISNMKEDAVKRYQKLTYTGPPWGPAEPVPTRLPTRDNQA